MKTENLWDDSNFTKFNNAILGLVVHDPTVGVRARIIVCIVRLSSGFGRRITNGRLAVKDFATTVGCSESAASRAIRCLLKEKRIFRSDPQGDHYYYSVYAPNEIVLNASRQSADANESGVKAVKEGVDACERNCGIASTPLGEKGKSHNPLLALSLQIGAEKANMVIGADPVKKSLKEMFKENLKEKKSFNYSKASKTLKNASDETLKGIIASKGKKEAVEYLLKAGYPSEEVEERIEKLDG